ncbi:MAG TPA: AAA family ATPase [Candidatus Deferrimicrobium sp.]|nr:AAA family ATPase [Candidatus Deferrimicrobium sp.]
MIITISGFHGTGKSTIARKLAEELKYGYIAAGQLFRQMAKDSQMNLEEFSEYIETHPEIDQEIDQKTSQEAKKGNMVLDGLLVAWKTKDISDIHILLTAAEEIRVKRIAQREKRPFKEVKKETLYREKSELDRFKKIYNIDLNDYSIYDVVLNTGLWTEESVIRIIITVIKEHMKFIQQEV